MNRANSEIKQAIVEARNQLQDYRSTLRPADRAQIREQIKTLRNQLRSETR